MSPDDHERFDGLEAAMVRDLAEYAREHAREEGYHFVGPVEIELEVDDGMRKGDLYVDAEVDDAGKGLVGSLVLPGGKRIQLGDQTTVIGRLDECDVTLPDQKVSRRHAEVRPGTDGFLIADLGSTNGTEVNGKRVSEQLLDDGDRIHIGDTEIKFEAS